MGIPNVLGKELEDAKRHLDKAGYSNTIVVRYESHKEPKDVDSLRVVRQRLVEDEMKSGNNLIQLVVCGFKTSIAK